LTPLASQTATAAAVKNLGSLWARPSQLGAGAVHIWWVDADAAIGAVDLLDHTERARLNEFASLEAMHHFLLGRTLAKCAVAHYAGCKASAVLFDSRCPRCGAAHGRPTVKSPLACGVKLSISHSGALVGVAVSRHAVGFDVQALGGGSTHVAFGDFEHVAAAMSEVIRLNEGHASSQLLLWSVLESVGKLKGTGLAAAPRDLLKTFDGADVQCVPAPRTSYAAAVALAEPIETLQSFDATSIVRHLMKVPP
jgi:4'-phosphopantetheinyl transferase